MIRPALALAFLLPALTAPLAAVAADKPAAAVATVAENSDAKRAKALLKSAVKFYGEKGERALVAFNQQEVFTDGELYVYVLGSDGRLLASGGPSSALIGRDVSAIRDAAGKPLFSEMIKAAQAKGSGEVEYPWLNPADNKVELKHTYFEKVGERVIAVGFYLPRATPEQAKAMLEEAAKAVETKGEAAYAEFNRFGGRFHQGDLYVFAVGLKDGKVVAHGTNPALVGRPAAEVVDPDGKPVLEKMLAMAKASGAGELDYRWRNPVTGKVEYKHSFFRKTASALVAVGYYAR
ncbi:MAG TPA: cache domain-containing protein [Rhodocyclaceae bacterium]